MLWDIFCQVIDNYGDMGVCWRLSADLAARGHRVRLWADDTRMLDWMAPQPRQVEVHDWRLAQSQPPEAGDVVIEAFGCNPPQAFVQRMQRPRPPVWINLEYLSAQDYVERSHQLPSPVWSGAGAGLTKWFFYPGFTAQTGGLLREPDLMARRDAFLAQADTRVRWLADLGVCVEPQATVISVFCYDSAPLIDWLNGWALAQASLTGINQDAPLMLLLTPGPATRLVRQWQQSHPSLATSVADRLRWHELPLLPQTEFDKVLWASDANVVRGEDSAVRALWAGKPHIWQIYEQDDGVHADKLDAFMDRWMAGWPRDTQASVRRLWLDCNGLLPDRPQGFNPLEAFAALAREPSVWADWSRKSSQKLASQADLCTQLIQFAVDRG